MSARGSAVANSPSAKSSGVWEDREKSIAENVALPDDTSGTLESVVAVLEQVTSFWMAITVLATSAGRAVLPITKQALAWRCVRDVVGRAVLVERMLRMVSTDVGEVRMVVQGCANGC